MKKWISVGVLCAGLMMPVTNASAASDDITGHYFESEMRALINKGVIAGFGNGMYQPDTKISRAQFASMMIRALQHEGLFATDEHQAGAEYSDVQEGSWYYSDIQKATKAGIIKGYEDGSFKPDHFISRQEMAVMAGRAIEKKAVPVNPSIVNFQDSEFINQDYVEPVEKVVSLGVMVGKGDNFAPLDQTTRGETSAVINRFMKLDGGTGENPLPEEPKEPEAPEPIVYRVAEYNANGTTSDIKEYPDFDTARKNLVGNQVIMKGDRVVFIKNGLVVSNRFTEIYDSSKRTGKSRTYVNTGTELHYIDASDDWVRVSIGYQSGYVNPNHIDFIHSSQVKGRSFYENRNGELYHSVYNHLNHTSYGFIIGKAPSFMTAGQKYYSEDGIRFTDVNDVEVGSANNFNSKLLTTPSNYSAEQLDAYLTAFYPNVYARSLADYLIQQKEMTEEEAEEIASESQLAGLGSVFKEVEATYGVNALYLMAHAIHESAWGTSTIAYDKKNLFGYGAIDADPYNGAYSYESFEESIKDAAIRISTNYLAPRGIHHNGAILGHKGAGMNVKYASDPYWGEKIAGHMYRADQYLGGLDSN